MAAKVFIAWSGSRGAQFARELTNWLKHIPFADPWMSEDIDPGAQFFTAIQEQLEITQFGIICLTSDNRDSPWLNFEAGFLKARDKLYPLMLDSERKQVTGPLDFLQAKRCVRKNVFPIVEALNQISGDSTMPPDELHKSFKNWWWPNLETRLKLISGGEQSDSRPSRLSLVTKVSQESAPRPVSTPTPGREAFIIVDIQNDFFSGGPLAVPDAETLIPKLNVAIQDAFDQSMEIIFTIDSHPSDHKSFEPSGEWPIHCVQHTRGAALRDDLKFPSKYVRSVIPFGDAQNDGVSPFENTDLAKRLELHDGRKFKTIYVAGIALEYCVLVCCIDALEFAERVVALEPIIRSVTLDGNEAERHWRTLKSHGVVRGQSFADEKSKWPRRPTNRFPPPHRTPPVS